MTKLKIAANNNIGHTDIGLLIVQTIYNVAIITY